MNQLPILIIINLLFFYSGYRFGLRRFETHWDEIGTRVANRIRAEGIKIFAVGGDGQPTIDEELLRKFEAAEPPADRRGLN